MRKKVFLTGIISLALIFALVFSACKSDDDNNSGNQSGGGTGVGSITITGIKAGLNSARIVHSTVSGTHNDFQASYSLAGGVVSNGVFDSSGSSTIGNGTVNIPVRGTFSNTATYEFKDGIYTVTLTVSSATDQTLDGQYTISVTFNGSNGTATANSSNRLGVAAP